jgi:hypothetical protein
MSLPFAVDHPGFVLAEGRCSGFPFVVTHNGMGYRCGYVRIPPGHPWYGRARRGLRPIVPVHGGITYVELGKAGDDGVPDDGWWIGFDAGHAELDDGPDPELPRVNSTLGTLVQMSLLLSGEMLPEGKGTVRDTATVVEWCRELAFRAAAAADDAATDPAAPAEPVGSERLET